MRIVGLRIENFRAVSRVQVDNLPDAVVLAGPNGCGKSSVLDAVRLLKSAYGQYHDNEWQSWFSEFQLNIQQLGLEANRVLQDISRPMLIAADIELAESEKQFLREHGSGLVHQLAWTRVRGPAQMPGRQAVVTPLDRRVHARSVEQVAAEMTGQLVSNLELPQLRAEITMDRSGEVTLKPATALEIVFGVYAPQSLGVIDYHSANRSYGREQVASVNLNVSASDERFRQSALYNTQNKYTNVKAEMASAYVQDLLAREAGVPPSSRANLNETLKELFTVFFPGKRFLGPQPTDAGKLLFPVELENGAQHDIDDLSSGEKEVLLGYLRLRGTAPSNSVVLLDEPELHLNPRLIRGLPRFYQKHVGEALGNQLWMITHSDTLLREAVEEPSFAVYHMHPAVGTPAGENQVQLIAASEQVQRAVIDLVGDLASYSPRARIVLLEGGGDSEVDLNIIRNLFPEFAEKVNIVSAGSKRRVLEVHDLLERASAAGRFQARFFSIVDRDSERQADAQTANRFAWDVYHVENYLLHSEYIRTALEELELGGPAWSVERVERELLYSARETVDGLIRQELMRHVNSTMVRCISTAIDPNTTLVAPELRAAAERSSTRLSEALANAVSLESLEEAENQLREELESALANGTWRAEFRGRDVLKRLVSRVNVGVPYEKFRNLVVNRMRHHAYRPPGMLSVINAILAR